MEISRYQKLFGMGPVGLAISLLLLGFLYLLNTSLGHAKMFRYPGPIRTVGLILIGIWICWHAWCIKTISQWWNRDKLCTTGPYRFVRHPIYAGGIWFGFLGISLMFNSWIMLSWPVIMHAVYLLLVRKEEAMMTSFFGEEYRCYSARTGRLFPRLFGN